MYYFFPVKYNYWNTSRRLYVIHKITLQICIISLSLNSFYKIQKTRFRSSYLPCATECLSRVVSYDVSYVLRINLYLFFIFTCVLQTYVILSTLSLPLIHLIVGNAFHHDIMTRLMIFWSSVHFSIIFHVPHRNID